MQAEREKALRIDAAAPLFIVMNPGSGHADAAAVRQVIEETVAKHHRQLGLEIEYKSKAHRECTPTLFVSNNTLQPERIGIREAPALEHGRLVAPIPRAVGKLEMLWLAARGALGSLGEADEVVSFAFTRITVQPRGRRRNVNVATDGEIFRLDAPIVFEVAPKPLLLLKPEPGERAEPS